ncbi:hypothetical protein ABBQ38_003529 [Trebouxia sp. C0009 RCD-2024]
MLNSDQCYASLQLAFKGSWTDASLYVRNALRPLLNHLPNSFILWPCSRCYIQCNFGEVCSSLCKTVNLLSSMTRRRCPLGMILGVSYEVPGIIHNTLGI